jgi:hypothetical protein
MMFKRFFVVASLTLVACSADASPAKQELMAHSWAPTEEACGTDFLRVTPTAFEVHHADSPATAIQVFGITTTKEFPNHVMVVVGPNKPGSPEPVSEEDKVGFVLDISNKRMTLVGAGAPTQLGPITPDNPNFERFNRVACS